MYPRSNCFEDTSDTRCLYSSEQMNVQGYADHDRTDKYEQQIETRNCVDTFHVITPTGFRRYGARYR